MYDYTNIEGRPTTLVTSSSMTPLQMRKNPKRIPSAIRLAETIYECVIGRRTKGSLLQSALRFPTFPLNVLCARMFSKAFIYCPRCSYVFSCVLMCSYVFLWFPTFSYVFICFNISYCP